MTDAADLNGSINMDFGTSHLLPLDVTPPSSDPTKHHATGTLVGPVNLSCQILLRVMIFTMFLSVITSIMVS